MLLPCTGWPLQQRALNTSYQKVVPRQKTPAPAPNSYDHVRLQALGASVLKGLLFVAVDLGWNTARCASWHILRGLVKQVKAF